MQDKLTKQLPWLLAHLIWFLVLPLAVNFFPEEAAPSVLTLLLVLLNPIFCAVTGLMYSLRGGRSLVFLVYPAAGWVGSLLVYYNESAWLYAVLGVFCGAAGGPVEGMRSFKAKRRPRHPEGRPGRRSLQPGRAQPADQLSS